MKRKEHKIEVKRKILKTSRELFKQQGYQSTTIRQITKAADVKIGTLYHFFKNKEDIFTQMVSGVFDRVLEKSAAMVKGNDPSLRFALELKLHLEAIIDDRRSAELYYITHTSKWSSQKILAKQLERAKDLWKDALLPFLDSDYEVRVLFERGYMLSVAIQCLNEQPMDASMTITKAIQLVLQMYQISDEQIDATIRQMTMLSPFKSIPITI